MFQKMLQGGGGGSQETSIVKIDDSHTNRILMNYTFNTKKGKTIILMGTTDKDDELILTSGGELIENYKTEKEDWISYLIYSTVYIIKATADTITLTANRVYSWILLEVD